LKVLKIWQSLPDFDEKMRLTRSLSGRATMRAVSDPGLITAFLEKVNIAKPSASTSTWRKTEVSRHGFVLFLGSEFSKSYEYTTTGPADQP